MVAISARFFVFAAVDSTWPFLLTESLAGMAQYQYAAVIDYVAVIAPSSLVATAIRHSRASSNLFLNDIKDRFEHGVENCWQILTTGQFGLCLHVDGGEGSGSPAVRLAGATVRTEKDVRHIRGVRCRVLHSLLGCLSSPPKKVGEESKPGQRKVG